MGGILGVGRNASDGTYNAFWSNVNSDVKDFTLRMRPSKEDLHWLESFNNTDTTSFAMVGSSNRYKTIDLKSLSTEKWVFGLQQLTFGDDLKNVSLIDSAYID